VAIYNGVVMNESFEDEEEEERSMGYGGINMEKVKGQRSNGVMVEMKRDLMVVEWVRSGKGLRFQKPS